MELSAFLEKTVKPKPSYPLWVKLLFGVGILICLILIFIALSEPLSYPKNVRVSNVTSKSLTLSWTTDVPTNTKVLVSEVGSFSFLPVFFFSTYKDDRDDGSIDNKRLTHNVTLTNLKPSTRYVANIYSGIRSTHQQKLTTGPQLITPKPNLVYGKITGPKGEGVEGVLVYLRLFNSQASASALLSSVTDSKGMWSIETSNARTRNLSRSFSFSNRSYELLIVDDGRGNRFKATTTPRADKPWPTVVLSASASGDLKNE